MNWIETTTLNEAQRLAIFNLWNSEYPQEICYARLIDLDQYLTNLTDGRHCFLLDEQDHIKGWGYVFTRNEGRWFAIILSRTLQHKGWGLRMLDKLKQGESELNGWIVEGMQFKKSDQSNYVPPLDFYLRNGFSLYPETRLVLPAISAFHIKWVNENLT